MWRQIRRHGEHQIRPDHSGTAQHQADKACPAVLRRGRESKSEKEKSQSRAWLGTSVNVAPPHQPYSSQERLAWSLSRKVQNLCTTPGHGEAFWSTSLISYTIASLSRTSNNHTCPQASVQELILSSLYSTYSRGVRTEAEDTHQHTQTGLQTKGNREPWLVLSTPSHTKCKWVLRALFSVHLIFLLHDLITCPDNRITKRNSLESRFYAIHDGAKYINRTQYKCYFPNKKFRTTVKVYNSDRVSLT